MTPDQNNQETETKNKIYITEITLCFFNRLTDNSLVVIECQSKKGLGHCRTDIHKCAQWCAKSHKCISLNGL